jgi:hypothetical protein
MQNDKCMLYKLIFLFPLLWQNVNTQRIYSESPTAVEMGRNFKAINTWIYYHDTHAELRVLGSSGCAQCINIKFWYPLPHTSDASSWYFCFSSVLRAYHHSPKIFDTVRLSWFGCRWWTKALWRLLNIMKAFIGRRIRSRSFTCYKNIG